MQLESKYSIYKGKIKSLFKHKFNLRLESQAYV